LIEIIQIVKFKEPIRLEKGAMFQNYHVLGETVLNFRHQIPRNATIFYSILIRDEYGVLDTWLTDENGPSNLGERDCCSADQDLWERLQELWKPRLLDMSESSDEG